MKIISQETKNIIKKYRVLIRLIVAVIAIVIIYNASNYYKETRFDKERIEFSNNVKTYLTEYLESYQYVSEVYVDSNAKREYHTYKSSSGEPDYYYEWINNSLVLITLNDSYKNLSDKKKLDYLEDLKDNVLNKVKQLDEILNGILEKGVITLTWLMN